MKIGIDVDDTLTNTKDLQLIYWKEFYRQNPKPNYSEELPTTINDFGDTYVQEFWDAYRLKLNFESTVKKDVSLYLKKLKENNHTLCIVTSRPKNKYNDLHKLTEDWLHKHDIPIDIIYTDVLDKGLFCKEHNIDILIDDDIKHIKRANELNVKAILFNSNPNYKGKQATSWQDVYNIINEIKE